MVDLLADCRIFVNNMNDKIKTDKTGHLIPESIIKDWKEAEDLGDFMLSKLQEIKFLCKEKIEEENHLFVEVTKSALADLSNAITSIKCVVPYAVCPVCEGRMKETCTLCRKRGFISKFRWDNCVPEEIKMIRMRGKSSSHQRMTREIIGPKTWKS